MFLTLIQQTTLGFKLKTLLLYLTLDNFFLFVGQKSIAKKNYLVNGLCLTVYEVVDVYN